MPIKSPQAVSRLKRIKQLTVNNRMHFLWAFVGILVPLLAVGYLTRSVVYQGGFLWDGSILELLQRSRTSFVDSAAIFVTNLGRVYVLGPVCLLIVSRLVYKRKVRLGLYLALGYGGALLFGLIGKGLFKRPRPSAVEALTNEVYYSFPSMHAMGAMALAASLIFAFWHTRAKWPLLLAAPFIALVIGASRPYLGVHYPTDILAGWLLGIAWAVSLYFALLRGRAR